MKKIPLSAEQKKKKKTDGQGSLTSRVLERKNTDNE